MALKLVKYKTSDRNAASKKGLEKVAFQWLIEHSCFVSSSVMADSLILRIHNLLITLNFIPQTQTIRAKYDSDRPIDTIWINNPKTC